jgi:DNA-binding CsgD family transcriptional regulator
LTERQVEVMQRIDRRLPIKLIARELGVSETRINQHIRALKDIFGVTNLGDLVLEYRAEFGGLEDDRHAQDDEKISLADQGSARILKGAEGVYYSFPQLPADPFCRDGSERDEAATLEFQDVMPMLERAPWLRPGEPKVVPGVLDGEHAVLLRLAVIIGIAFGFLAAVVLTVTAAITIGEALNGRANIPVDQRGFA